jgi:hypothetical protein
MICVVDGRDVYRFEGVRALFKGLGPTLSGVVPARYIKSQTGVLIPGQLIFTLTTTQNVS